jgi:hypothetical protein
MSSHSTGSGGSGMTGQADGSRGAERVKTSPKVGAFLSRSVRYRRLFHVSPHFRHHRADERGVLVDAVHDRARVDVGRDHDHGHSDAESIEGEVIFVAREPAGRDGRRGRHMVVAPAVLVVGDDEQSVLLVVAGGARRGSDSVVDPVDQHFSEQSRPAVERPPDGGVVAGGCWSLFGVKNSGSRKE